jgi:Winged helix DNA-binding domain
VWDASLLVHARRTGILPEELRPRVFTIRRPHGVSTFLVDGAVAGAWQFEDGRVTLEPFRRLDAADRRAVDAEAERLAAFAG